MTDPIYPSTCRKFKDSEKVRSVTRLGLYGSILFANLYSLLFTEIVLYVYSALPVINILLDVGKITV